MIVPELSRRQALALLGVGTAAVAAGAIGWASGIGAPARSTLSPVSGEGLRQPTTLDSHNRVLDVTLTAAPGVQVAGRPTAAWGYNGSYPGPTLRVRPGDLMRVRLVNHIGQPTNLHTHGLHVSPEGNGDNPFIAVAPGDSFDYEIAIPAEHPSGTFWYHPHHHGTAADQIFAGLAGALLVTGEPDLPVTEDLVLLVTDTTLDGAGRVVSPGPMERMQGREGHLVLVNGQHQPVIGTSRGAVQRWRIINGCVSRVLALRLDGHTMTQVALDGRFLPAPLERDRLVLAPGNRADLLVHPTSNGRYALMGEPYDRGTSTVMGGMMGSDRSGSGPVTLATLDVSGPPVATPVLPSTLPASPAPADAVAMRRQVTFAAGMSRMGTGGMAFTIDGRTFDPERDDHIIALGTTEEWTVVNTSSMDHPFHLHAWPFHVLDSPDGAGGATLQDVVLVPAGGVARLRIPFVGFGGRSVYHCHILDHEDLGMMATVHVQA